MKSFPSASFLLASLCSIPIITHAAPASCISGTFNFNSTDRIWIPKPLVPFNRSVDVAPLDTFDFILDYGPENTVFSPAGMSINIKKPPPGQIPLAARLSSNFYVLYGRLTARMKAIEQNGFVTTFITMSDEKDEIDWEAVRAGDGNHAWSNVFYRGIPEYGTWSQNLKLPNGGSIGQFHDYTMDWQKDKIIWSIDGQVIRTLLKSDANPTSDAGKATGQKWFPTTPSQIQLAAWDGGDDPNKGTSEWAGGPVSWTSDMVSAQWESLKVECYDDNGKVVPSFPLRTFTAITATSTTTTNTPGNSKPTTTVAANGSKDSTTSKPDETSGNFILSLRNDYPVLFYSSIGGILLIIIAAIAYFMSINSKKNRVRLNFGERDNYHEMNDRQ